MSTGTETLQDPRSKRLARNEIIRQRNKARAVENERNAHLRPPITTIVMSPCKSRRRKEQHRRSNQPSSPFFTDKESYKP